MLKKILAITLSMAMLMSVSAFASVDTDSFTGKITYTENFDDKTPTADATSNPATVSDVLAENTSEVKTRANIVDGAGPDGSKAMVVDNTYYNADNRIFGTVNLGVSSTMTHVVKLKYDFKLTKLYTGSWTWTCSLGGGVNMSSDKTSSIVYELFTIGKDGSLSRYSNGSLGDSGKDIEPGKWYTLEQYMDSSNWYGWIYESDTKTPVAYSTHSNSSSRAYSSAVILNGSSAVCSAGMTFDNIVAERYTLANVGPTIVKAPEVAGKTGVDVTTKTTKVQFDQMVGTSVKPTLTPADGTATACAISIDTTMPFTYNIALPTLQPSTTYTLDLSGVKNGGGATVGNSGIYTFTTAGPAMDVVSSTVANGATGVSEELKSFDITFTQPAINPPATVSVTGGATPITATVTAKDATNTVFTIDWSSYTDDLLGLTEYSVDLTGFVDADENESKTAAITFTTKSTAIEKIVEDFEWDFTGQSGFNTIPDSGSVPTKPEKPLTTGKGNISNRVYKVAGYNGGSAVQMQTKTIGSGVSPLHLHNKLTPAQNNGEWEKFVVTYRIKIEDLGDTGTLMYFTAGKTTGAKPVARVITYNDYEKAFFNSIGQEETYPDGEVIKNHWYNIIWTIDGINQTFMVVDAETGNVVFRNSIESDAYTAGEAITVTPLSMQRDGSSNPVRNHNLIVCADDFTVWRVKPWKAGNALEEAAKIVSATGIGASAEFTFNQPVVLAGNMFTVETGDETVTPAYTFKYPDFCKAIANFSDLNQKTDYNVSYSNIKSAGGAGFGGDKATKLFSFTTETAADEITGTAAYTGFNADDTITATLTSKSDLTANIFVAFTKGTEIQSVKPVRTALVEGANTVSITLDSAIDADGAKVYVWSLGKLVPLMATPAVAAQAQ